LGFIAYFTLISRVAQKGKEAKQMGTNGRKIREALKKQHKMPGPHFLIKREMPFSKVLSESRVRDMLHHQEIWILVNTSALILFKNLSEATFCILKF
jgi:hypothetical protein